MKIFKTCSCSKTPWFSRDEFLADGNIYLVGYQANFGDFVLGLFLFNHLTCQSTIGIPASCWGKCSPASKFCDRVVAALRDRLEQGVDVRRGRELHAVTLERQAAEVVDEDAYQAWVDTRKEDAPQLAAR